MNLIINDFSGIDEFIQFDQSFTRYACDSEIDAEQSMLFSLCPNRFGGFDLSNSSIIFERRLPTCIRSIYSADDTNFHWVYSDWHRQPFAIFRCDETFRHIELVYRGPDVEVSSIISMLGEIFPCYAIGFGGLVLHGVLMSYNGQGIILSAPSGTGKSTQAHLWREAGYSEIINGDLTLCSQLENQWFAHGIPWSGTSEENFNKSVIITAIIVLEQDNQNQVVRLKPSEALSGVLPNVLVPSWNRELYLKMLDLLIEMVSELPVYLFRCRPDLDALQTLKQEMDNLLGESKLA